jgi:hypothetical protein
LTYRNITHSLRSSFFAGFTFVARGPAAQGTGFSLLARHLFLSARCAPSETYRAIFSRPAKAGLEGVCSEMVLQECIVTLTTRRHCDSGNVGLERRGSEAWKIWIESRLIGKRGKIRIESQFALSADRRD